MTPPGFFSDLGGSSHSPAQHRTPLRGGGGGRDFPKSQLFKGISQKCLRQFGQKPTSGDPPEGAHQPHPSSPLHTVKSKEGIKVIRNIAN